MSPDSPLTGAIFNTTLLRIASTLTTVWLAVKPVPDTVIPGKILSTLVNDIVVPDVPTGL